LIDSGKKVRTRTHARENALRPMLAFQQPPGLNDACSSMQVFQPFSALSF